MLLHPFLGGMHTITRRCSLITICGPVLRKLSKREAFFGGRGLALVWIGLCSLTFLPEFKLLMFLFALGFVLLLVVTQLIAPLMASSENLNLACGTLNLSFGDSYECRVHVELLFVSEKNTQSTRSEHMVAHVIIEFWPTCNSNSVPFARWTIKFFLNRLYNF